MQLHHQEDRPVSLKDALQLYAVAVLLMSVAVIRPYFLFAECGPFPRVVFMSLSICLSTMGKKTDVWKVLYY